MQLNDYYWASTGKIFGRNIPTWLAISCHLNADVPYFSSTMAKTGRRHGLTKTSVYYFTFS
jgi:hypothetical protein